VIEADLTHAEDTVTEIGSGHEETRTGTGHVMTETDQGHETVVLAEMSHPEGGTTTFDATIAMSRGTLLGTVLTTSQVVTEEMTG
jgi:hypothetical protein